LTTRAELFTRQRSPPPSKLPSKCNNHKLLAVSNHRFSSLKRWSVRGFPTINTQHLLRVTTSHGQRIAVNVIRRRGQR
ncbi:hypothetical protein T08_6868, partial [Trichinella sp. T8]